MQKLYNFFLHRYLECDFVDFARARLTLHFCLITAFFSLFYAIIANIIDFHASARIMPALALLFFALAFLIRSSIKIDIISFLYLLLSFLAAILLIIKSGMIFSSITPWLAFIPMASNLLIGKKSSIAWLLVSIITVFILLYLSPSREAVEISYNPKFDGFFYAVVNNGLIGIVLVLSMIYQKSKDMYLALLQEKNEIISSFNIKLKSKNDEITAQNEELVQQKEEILAQREFIEARNQELIKVQYDLNDIIDKLTATQLDLEKREAENRSILKTMYGSQLLVAEIDYEGIFLKMSPMLIGIFGLSEKEVIGKSWDELIKTCEIELENDIDFNALWKEIFAGKHVSIEYPLKVRGKSHFFKENFFPILDENQKVIKVMLVGQDISQIHQQKDKIESLNVELTNKIKEIEEQNFLLIAQRKEIEEINKEIKKHNKEIKTINESLEKRVRKRTKNLEEKNKQLAEYAYINSHLLRGPLCSILGLVNLLESNSENDQKKIVLHMKKSSEELHSVVNKITQAIEDGSHFDRDLLSRN